MFNRKRKASAASPYELPQKLSKRTTSTTVSKKLCVLSKVKTVNKSLKPVDLSAPVPPMVSASAPVSDESSHALPALRRASTFTLDDDEEHVGAISAKTKPTKRDSSNPSLRSKKSSSLVKEKRLVTRLSSLKSGSIVGETSMASESFPREKSLSRKTSGAESRDGLPSIPSGLTKLAMPTGELSKGSLRVSKSKLVTDVDEAEVDCALSSLKSTLSKSRSISLAKSLSAASSASAKATLLKRSSTAKSTSSKTSVADKNEESGTADDKMDTDDAEPATGSAEAGLPPGGLMEVVISFDTTGSMYGCLTEVRAKVQDLIQRLQADIPGIRISVIAHGDYCDEASSYVVKWIDFGATLPEICDFVKNAERTGGGDGPECYELVMQRTREVLSWTPGSQRVLILIGDDLPHEPGYKYGGKTYNINWRDECENLRKMGVKIYGVQAHGGGHVSHFYKQISLATGGRHINLNDFSSMFDFIMMICYREANPDMIPIYEQEMRDRSGRLAADVDAFLRKDDTSAGPSFSFETAPAPLFFATPVSKKATKRALKVSSKPAKTSKVVKTKATIKKNKAPAKRVGKTSIKTLKVDKVEKREQLPDSCMTKGALRCVTWSKWVKVLTPNAPTDKSKSKFIKCRTQDGYTLKDWFDGGFNVPAVYEFAVKYGDRGAGKKYVVYCRISRGGFKRSGGWSTNLIRHKTIRKEANEALKQGCCIFVRRGTVKGRKVSDKTAKLMKVSDYIRDNLDYAWKKYIWRKADGGKQLKHRSLTVKKKGKQVFLSHADV